MSNTDIAENIFKAVVERDTETVMSLIGNLQDAVMIAVKRKHDEFFDGLTEIEEEIDIVYMKEIDNAMERVLEQNAPVCEKVVDLDFIFECGGFHDYAMDIAANKGDVEVVAHLVETHREHISDDVLDIALHSATTNLHTQLILYFIQEIGLTDYDPHRIAFAALLRGDADLLSVVLPRIDPKKFDDRLWRFFVNKTTLRGAKLDALLTPLAHANLKYYHM